MTEEELNALIAQAEGGDVAAMNQVAHVYSDNADFKDSEKAFIWYKNSAELGNVNSMSNLGAWCYLWGNGTEKSLKLAIEWLEKAAEKDDIWSICRLACDIYSQDNEFKDIDKALAWFEKIVERSVAVVQVDYDRALACVEKIAEEGNPKAICLMPRMLPDPFGGEHPDKWKWIQKAAEVGDAQCQYKMAEKMLSNNEDEDAYKWFALSAKEGNADAKTRLNSLGLDFQNGNNGRKQNQPLAYRCYVAAAECGNTDAMANVANCFANGIGVEKHLNKAFEYYKQSAEQGNRLGMSNLGGWCYLWGNGVERDVDKAIYWLAKAADECGDIWSMNKLTYIYGELEGYTNNEQAAKWFLALIQKDCDPNSGVYEKTGYNKDLYEKVKNTILNSSSENDIFSSLSRGASGGSLFGGSISFTSSHAKSYINEAINILKVADSRKLILQTINDSLTKVIPEIKEKHKNDIKRRSVVGDWEYINQLNNLAVHVSLDNDIQSNIQALGMDIETILKIKLPKDAFLMYGGSMNVSNAIGNCVHRIKEVLPNGYEDIQFVVDVDENSIKEEDELLRLAKLCGLKCEPTENMKALKKYISEVIEKTDSRLREVLGHR